MNMYVVERVPVEASADETVRHDTGTAPTQRLSSQLPQPVEWRWSPDPTETESPASHVEDDHSLSAALLRALAWASLHPWG